MLQLNFNPFPVLETERLILRAMVQEDENDLFFLRTDTEINKYIMRPKKDASLDDTRVVMERIRQNLVTADAVFWMIAFRDNPAAIGNIVLWNIDKEQHRGEVGYTLHNDYWGMGIMNEAMKAVLDYGFGQMKLDIVEAYTHRDNTSSRKLLERYGFERDVKLEAEKVGITDPETSVIYVLPSPLTQE